MNFTAAQISTFHRALYRSCGFPSLRLTVADERNWFEFLQVMAPLEEDTEEGAFCLADIVNVLAEMQRANSKRDAQFRFSMRPVTILRDPEKFRDMVLEERRKRRLRPRPEPIIKEVRAGAIVMAAEHDPAIVDRDFDFGAAIAAETARLEERP